MADSSERPRFQRVDWTAVDSRARLLTPERLTLLAGVGLLIVLILYDTYVAHVYLVGSWVVDPIDWAFLLGVVIIGAYLLVPAVRNRAATRRVLGAVRARPHLAASVGFLTLMALLGVFAAFVLGRPKLHFGYAFHAPYGFSAEAAWSAKCYGEITQGEGITHYCEGALLLPLGTNHRGIPMEYLVMTGARVAIYVVVFTAAFIVPLASAVGVAAGLRGGRLDDLLMTYVDVQLCIPAIFLYFIGYMYWGPSLLLLLATFGLLSWGGIARLVRSEVLQRREDGHVLVARSLGASDGYLARRHILPNVSNTLVPAIFHLFALLIIAEAGVAFLGFNDVELYSWGSTIAEGLSPRLMLAHEVWWISTIPAITLTLTVVSFKLLGDGLRDVLDPRGGN